MDKLKPLYMGTEVNEVAAAVRPVVTTHIESAQRVVTTSTSDLSAARDTLLSLQAAFEELEYKMAAMSAAIERKAEAVNAQAKASIQQAWLASRATEMQGDQLVKAVEVFKLGHREATAVR